MFICDCCLDTFSKQLLEVHHVVPKFLGGGDHESNLVNLCVICHTIIHKTANKILHGEDPQDFVEMSYDYIKSKVDQVLDFAKVIVKETTKDNAGTREIQNVEIPLDFGFYNLDVKDAAKACKVPIYKFLQKAVEEKVRNTLGYISATKDVGMTIRTKPSRRR